MEKEVEKIPPINSSDGEDNDDDDEDDDEEKKVSYEGAYDPQDYESLNVSQELKNIFSYITLYSPQTIELETKLMPFIPDFIPAVGDVDAFIKVRRPDNKEDTLGLTVLDEPSATSQSDPTLMSLKLKAISKDIKVSDELDTLVKTANSAKDIDLWIDNINHLHETTASTSTSVTLLHSHRLPDIEQLMQEWSEEFEASLNVNSLPTPDLDCSLEDYINIICAILDIPVHSSKIASLYFIYLLK
ncbi:intraflagellar transport protein 46 homolog [Oppia nitens]|uniref:intraflagellar transport protein 46 homolog n=1 Tax=Oppia nitens TaxID=1686743 RepID=UPI0023DB5E96|nr:intraflagellar transport protein 46 homolog [Oppia nitens]